MGRSVLVTGGNRGIGLAIARFSWLRASFGPLLSGLQSMPSVAWVPLAELESRLAYADERRLIRRATELLEDTA